MAVSESRRAAAAKDEIDPRDDATRILVGETFDTFPNDRSCFYCHDALGDAADVPSVYWNGPTRDGPTTVFLHPRCAWAFAGHLRKDANRTKPSS